MNTSPWNKDRIIGQKRPLQISHIWGIRIRLELEGKTRDLALFNMALDSKLRGCVNRPDFPGECFICELRLPDHCFRWKHNELFLLLPEE
ncbi:hypothetical protein Q5570_23995, partial [Escherichia coli]|nr:hypothetical protein [Escherichia coli]